MAEVARGREKWGVDPQDLFLLGVTMGFTKFWGVDSFLKVTMGFTNLFGTLIPVVGWLRQRKPKRSQPAAFSCSGVSGSPTGLVLEAAANLF